ncbi:hypothetical protein GCM10011583_01860 [Streptomyces camponoticapitis]|uniref:Uncharacterized protein n=1 Tax=Streptomyces camponoticapitis TaxID=1616125 RepID=A0ABQ2DXI7_9ACTN|nr:hypothetical protein [Streptomyces camponoticapitis]GGJ74074.1 hypothetical protein GCM10011583_01860 [Streptomyces camponoticapitis]
MGAALRWEYRREVPVGRERDAVETELAPDGWEPCGQWTYHLYGSGAVGSNAAPLIPVLVAGGIAGWAGVRKDLLDGTEDEAKGGTNGGAEARRGGG